MGGSDVTGTISYSMPLAWYWFDPGRMPAGDRCPDRTDDGPEYEHADGHARAYEGS